MKMHQSQSAFLAEDLAEALGIPKKDSYKRRKLERFVLFQSSYCFESIGNDKICKN